MMQPAAISAAVEKPNSSAPSKMATAISRPVFELTVRLHDDAAAQVVDHEGLVCLGQPQFPRNPGVLE